LKKRFNFLLVLVMAISLFLMPAVAMAADPPAPVEGTPLITNSTYGVQYSVTYPDIYTSTLVIPVGASATLGDISSISWESYLVEGYAPHVDILLDVSGDGNQDDALVVEYAYNNPSATTAPTYGCTTGAWLATFGGDPVAVISTSNMWLTSQAPGPLTAIEGAGTGYESLSGGFYYATLADWVSGEYVIGIDADTSVTAIEIEVDNWVVFTEAYVKNIVVNSTSVGTTTTVLEDVISISVVANPTTLDFGPLYPGDTSILSNVLTITNTGSVDAKVTVTTAAEFYNAALSLDTIPISTWSGTILETESVEVDASVTVPSGWSAGVEAGTIIFWVEEVPTS